MIPVEIDIRDFLCFKRVHFAFDQLSPVVLINGVNSETSSSGESNGSGKSSLLDAVEWANYGRIRGIFSKDLVKDDVIRDEENAKFARVIWTFKLGKDYIRIKRQKDLEGPTTLEVHSSRDRKKWKNLTLTSGVNKRTGKKENSITRTQQVINDLLNANCDLFINSVFFEQQNTNTFALSKGSEKEDLLREALYLERWVDYGREGKTRRTKVDKEKYALQYALDQADFDDLQEKIEELSESINTYKGRQVVAQKSSDRLEKNLHQIDKKLQKFKNAAEQMDRLRILRDEDQDELTAIEDEERRNMSSLKSDSIKCSAQFEFFEDAERVIKTKTVSLKELDEVDEDQLEKYENRIEEVRDEAARLQGERDAIDKIVCDREGCPIGDEVLKKKQKDKINGRIFSLNRLVMKTEKKYTEVQDLIDKRVDLKSVIDSARTLKIEAHDEIKHFQKTIDENKKRANLLYQRAEKKNERIKQTGIEMLELESTDYEALENERHDAQSEYETAVTEISEYSTKITRCETNLGIKKNKVKELEETKVKFNKICDRERVLAYTIKMVNREIPHQLIEAALPEIEGYAQQFIDHLSGGRMTLDFITQREIARKDKETGEQLKTDTLDMMVEVNGKQRKYALVSGGQKTRVDIAVHLGYATFILNRAGAKLETLFFDEVASALDQDGKDCLVSLFDRLITEFGFKQIFLISQDSRLNKMFNSIITIKNTSEGSKILATAA